MNIGALLGPVADATNTRTLAEQARAYAGEGFTSLWSAHAQGRGQMITDPLIALTVAATVTEDVELGTAILQVPLYQSVDLAHRWLSLRQLCGDRLILGVGVGSTEHDFKAYERDYQQRFHNFDQSMVELRELLNTGKRGDADLTPWPAVLTDQRIFLGTWGKGVERAAQGFAGWIASGAYREVHEVEAAAARFHAAGGGRSLVSTILVSAKTDLGQLRENFARYAAAGFDDAVVMLLPGAPALKEVRALVA